MGHNVHSMTNEKYSYSILNNKVLFGNMGQVNKSDILTVHAINKVAVQNLHASFCYVYQKDFLQHFSVFVVLASRAWEFGL